MDLISARFRDVWYEAVWCTTLKRTMGAPMLPPSREPPFLLHIYRELNHPVRDLFGLHAGKVLEHQLLDEEPHEIAQLERTTTCSENKIAVATVHHDQVAVGIKSRAPQLPSGPFEGVTRQSAS